jgi:hypothetical protein
MAQQDDAARRATQTLYERQWLNSQPAQAIMLSLELLSEGYEKSMKASTYKLYTAVLSGLTKEEIVLAFCRASEECKSFFPSPATLREFSGRVVDGDPIAREAKAELLKLIEGMRGPHGPMLRPLLGPVLYGTEDDPKDETGSRTHAPIRGKSTPFPIARRTQAALVRLGWGDIKAGIALVADHPAVRERPNYKTEPDDDQFRKNQLRASDEILKRFTDAYREIRCDS